MISSKAICQDCNALNEFVSFRGIKLGEHLPKELRKYSETHLSVGDTIFTIYKKNIPPKDLEKMTSYFYFGDDFSGLMISTIPDGRIFGIRLFRYYNTEDSLTITKNIIPSFYDSITDHLAFLFGKNYKQGKFTDALGDVLVRRWECNKIAIDFVLNYGISEEFQLDISDRELYRVKKLEDYKKTPKRSY